MFTTNEYQIAAGVTASAENGIVFVRGESTTITLAANEWNIIGTLSNELAPSRDIQFCPSNMGGWVDLIGGIGTNGQIRIFPKETTTFWKFIVSYPYKG